MKIKKGDTVAIIAGKDKGKKGTVTRALPREGAVIVEGANMRKRHKRARSKGEAGQIVEFEAPINVSNVALLDPKSGSPTRVGAKMESGGKSRVAKKSGIAV